jgi:hypothetical protein
LFENRVLRKMFVPKRSEVTGEWERVHNEELDNLDCSSNIIRVIKSKIKKWARHVARMGTGEVRTGVWWENLRERDHLEDFGGMENNIKIGLQEVGWGMDWINLD